MEQSLFDELQMVGRSVPVGDGGSKELEGVVLHPLHDHFFTIFGQVEEGIFYSATTD